MNLAKLSPVTLLAVLTTFVTLLSPSIASTAGSDLSYFSRPIAETCGILNCPSDLSFPPCSNNTHHGEKGEPGDQGDKGPDGDVGLQGPEGPRGEKGESGFQGVKGERGPKGSQGEKGDDGQKGEPGTDGRVWNGAQGNQGEVGSQGTRGPQGKSGCSGEQGDRGSKGQQGKQGPQGLNGGRGIQGEKGHQGDPGPVGRPGARGPAGLTGPEGDNGTLGDKGPIGPQGSRGYFGERGPKGLPPRVFDAKNLRGPRGERGVAAQCPKLVRFPGPIGEKGSKGEKGIKGEQGGSGRPGPDGLCYPKVVNFEEIIFPPHLYGDRGPRGPVGTGTRGAAGEPGVCDNSTCHCKKNCTDETTPIYADILCQDNGICKNPPPPEKFISERGSYGPRGLRGPQGMPGEGVRGTKGPRGINGKPYPSDKPCNCCPDCLRFSNTETYAVHAVSTSDEASCYDSDEELYKGYSLMHYASYSPSPTVSQDLADIGSCIPQTNEFTAVPFQSCSASEGKCRFAERRPVVIWLSNDKKSDDSRMLNAAETAQNLGRCVACRSRGGIFFVNHTLSTKEPSCPDTSELWNMRYGSLTQWTWKLRYTGFTWAMYQANDVQGGNMLQSPGSCYPGKFGKTLFYECQGPNRCYNKFGEFKNYWMMNAEEANRRFYSMNTSTPTTPTGKYRREDVPPSMHSSILARCAVCELVPPECTNCKMQSEGDEKQPSTFTYVIHSQKAGGANAVPECSDQVDPSDEVKPVWTGYSLTQISHGNSGTSASDLGGSGSCIADFDSTTVVKQGGSSNDISQTLSWLSGRDLAGNSQVNMADAAASTISRCAVCMSRYPVVVVHSSADSTADEAPACPDSGDVVLWQGYSLSSISRDGNRVQHVLSTSTGSCLKEINDGTCEVECNPDDRSCRTSANSKFNWALRKDVMTQSVFRDGRLSENPGDALTFDWRQFISRCTVCALRSAF